MKQNNELAQKLSKIQSQIIGKEVAKVIEQPEAILAKQQVCKLELHCFNIDRIDYLL